MNIAIDRKVIEQALAAMEYADACLKKQLTTKTKHEYAQDLLLDSGTALRTALEQPEQSWTPENLAAMRRLQEKQYQRDAMRQKVQQEPVLWKDKHGKTLMSLDASQPIQELVCRTALEQPKRKPLTDEEIKTYRHMIDWTAEWSYINFARAIEAAHGIKESI